MDYYPKLYPIQGLAGMGGGATSFLVTEKGAGFLAWTNYNGDRGCWGGGYNSGYKDQIDYVTIASTGNATDFGDLTQQRRENSACSNGTRGVWGGGRENDGSTSDTLDYITIANTGNATNFGNLAIAMKTASATSNGTRGIYWVDTTINYITIANTGNASDFGDLTLGRNSSAAAAGAD